MHDGVTGDLPSANASSRQLLRNFVTSYLGLAVSMVLSLFLTPVVLRQLGTTNYGLWAVILSIGGYISIVDSGVSTATVQQVAHCLAIGDDDRLAEVLGTARLFFGITGILAVIITAVMVPFFGGLFHPPHSSLAAARLGLLLMGVFTGLTLVTNQSQAALFGSGRNDRSAVLNIVLAPSIIGAEILVVLAGGGLVGLFAVSAVGAIVGLLATNRLAARTGLPVRGRGRATWPMLKELMRAGLRNVMVSAAWVIAYNLDVLVIGLILPVRQITPYDIALSTATLSRSLATSGTGLLLPTYTHASAQGDDEGQFRLYSRAVMTTMAICIPIVVAVIAFGQSLLRLWLHDVPPQTYKVMIALNIVLALQLPAEQSGLLLMGRGRTGFLARVALPTAVANLGMSVAGTYLFGPVGPALGSAPQVVIVEMVILPMLCCSSMHVPFSRYLRHAMAPLSVPLVAAAATAAALIATVGNHSEVAAPIESVVVALVAWAAMLVFLMRTDPVVARFVSKVVLRRADAT